MRGTIPWARLSDSVKRKEERVPAPEFISLHFLTLNARWSASQHSHHPALSAMMNSMLQTVGKNRLFLDLLLPGILTRNVASTAAYSNSSSNILWVHAVPQVFHWYVCIPSHMCMYSHMLHSVLGVQDLRFTKGTQNSTLAELQPHGDTLRKICVSTSIWRRL